MRKDAPTCRGCGEDFDGSRLYCQRCSTEKIYLGFTRSQLSEAFDMVKDISNWKSRISAKIDKADITAVDAAIAFYAGGGADFTPTNDGRIRVTAPGYYVMIGA